MKAPQGLANYSPSFINVGKRLGFVCLSLDSAFSVIHGKKIEVCFSFKCIFSPHARAEKQSQGPEKVTGEILRARSGILGDGGASPKQAGHWFDHQHKLEQPEGSPNAPESQAFSVEPKQ